MDPQVASLKESVRPGILEDEDFSVRGKCKAWDPQACGLGSSHKRQGGRARQGCARLQHTCLEHVCCMLMFLFFPVMYNPSRAVTLPNIGVPF